MSSNIGDSNLADYFPQQNHPSQAVITAFLAKLWALVNDPSCDDLIAWDPSGGSFHVFDQSRFAREILPRYFKHNNFASFIRQLNMYGFRKISTIEHGSLKSEHDDIEFAHPNFIRGHDTLLELIKRRAPDNQQKSTHPIIKTEVQAAIPIPPPTPTVAAATSSSALVSSNPTDSKVPRSIELTHLYEDVRNLQSKQTSLSDKLFHVEDENQALWREISILKQKHTKQQQIVSKLMKFLLHFLTNSTHTHRPSVEQQQSNQSQEQPNTIVNSSISANSLKRKPAAIMLSEEPNKRTSSQQPHMYTQTLNPQRSQGIIINELPDTEIASWIHNTDAPPLVDLVPSPPPPSVPSHVQSTSIQSLDDTFSQQVQPNNFTWPVPTDEIQNLLGTPQSNKVYKMIENGNHESNEYIPDFFLNTDSNNDETNTNGGQIHDVDLSDINTSSKKCLPIMKTEQIEFPNRYLSILNPSIYPDETQQKQVQLVNASESTPLSLNDLTGDVDHIQTSLDNIRELMFDNLPDGTSIEDLFGDEHSLLSPLLQNPNC